jgi:glycerol-3-phosphate dehydrogenase (NAD(P)+)
MSRIIVLGSGAWGTALALSLHRRGGHQVTLWAHSPEFAQEIVDAGENKLFLPGFPIPSEIAITGESAAVRDAEIVLSVIPSEFLRSAFSRIRPYLHPGQIIVSATKGVEDRTFLRMTEVIADCLANETPQSLLGSSSVKDTGFSAKGTSFSAKGTGFGVKGTGFSPYINFSKMNGL